jgi:hypothetical protein
MDTHDNTRSRHSAKKNETKWLEVSGGLGNRDCNSQKENNNERDSGN